MEDEVEKGIRKAIKKDVKDGMLEMVGDGVRITDKGREDTFAELRARHINPEKLFAHARKLPPEAAAELMGAIGRVLSRPPEEAAGILDDFLNEIVEEKARRFREALAG